jgi:hypothetical protein
MLDEEDGDDPIGEDQGKRTGCSFKRAAEKETPLAAGDVLHHEQSEAADGPAECEYKAEHPCAHEVFPAEMILGLAEESENHGDDPGNRGNDDCA